MNTKTKVILAGVAALALGIVLLPRPARRIDSTVEPGLERTAAMEAQYREMTNLYPIAAEMVREHPTHRLWAEHRAALMDAGYIETRELRLRHSLAGKGALRDFVAGFRARFPAVEFRIREIKSDEPVVMVTARKSDFGPLGAIERFVSQYEPSK